LLEELLQIAIAVLGERGWGEVMQGRERQGESVRVYVKDNERGERERREVFLLKVLLEELRDSL